MAFDLKTYKTIKEAIWHSTPDKGIMACYEDTEGKQVWFVLGRPSIIFKKQFNKHNLSEIKNK